MSTASKEAGDFYLLENNDYNVLLKHKKQIGKEMDALASIVLTANMNVQVLMQDVVEKKKRAITRIDASTVGKIFLSQMIENAEVDELPFLVRRLKAADRLIALRTQVNNELRIFQQYAASQQVDASQKKVLLWKFIKTKQQDLSSKTRLGVATNELDDLDVFVNSILVEEMNWLRQQILNPPQ